MCNYKNYSTCYAMAAHEVHTLKNENKRKSLKDIFLYYFLFYMFIPSWKFVIIEIRA